MLFSKLKMTREVVQFKGGRVRTGALMADGVILWERRPGRTVREETRETLWEKRPGRHCGRGDQGDIVGGETRETHDQTSTQFSCSIY